MAILAFYIVEFNLKDAICLFTCLLHIMIKYTPRAAKKHIELMGPS